MEPEDVLNYGLYRIYPFNERDRRLREAGFYCEQILHSTCLAGALEQLTSDLLQEGISEFAILPAKEVVVQGENISVSNKFALYMQIRGRLEPEPQQAQLETQAPTSRMPGGIHAFDPDNAD